jgi:hypothetical protein
MPSTPLYVTDHALLRYIERIHGVDVEILRAELRQMALRGAEAAERIGGGEYTIVCEPLRLRVVGANVVTVLAPRDRR